MSENLKVLALQQSENVVEESQLGLCVVLGNPVFISQGDQGILSLSLHEGCEHSGSRCPGGTSPTPGWLHTQKG